MKLEQHERDSALWQRIEEVYLKPRLDTLRRRNDRELDPVETAKLRGRIAEIKGLLGIAEDAPKADG